MTVQPMRYQGRASLPTALRLETLSPADEGNRTLIRLTASQATLRTQGNGFHLAKGITTMFESIKVGDQVANKSGKIYTVEAVGEDYADHPWIEVRAAGSKRSCTLYPLNFKAEWKSGPNKSVWTVVTTTR